MGCVLQARTSAAHQAMAPRAPEARPPADGRSPILLPDERSSRSQIRRRQMFPNEGLLRTLPRQGAQPPPSSESFFDENFNRAHAVAPANLLPLRARARIECHWQLVDAV